MRQIRGFKLLSAASYEGNKIPNFFKVLRPGLFEKFHKKCKILKIVLRFFDIRGVPHPGNALGRISSSVATVWRQWAAPYYSTGNARASRGPRGTHLGRPTKKPWTKMEKNYHPQKKNWSFFFLIVSFYFLSFLAKRCFFIVFLNL